MDTNVSGSTQNSAVCRFHLDGEMLGSIPGKHALVEIALCTVAQKGERQEFYVLIRPDGGPYEYGAMRVLRRSYEDYLRDGIDPRDAAHKLIEFLKSISNGRKIEISCVNPGFDIGFLKVFLAFYADDEVGVIGFKSYDVVSYACASFDLPLSEMSTGKAWRLLLEKAPYLHLKYFKGEGNHNASVDTDAQTDLLLALEEYVWEKRARFQ